jgi:proteasome accessory factor A
MAIPKVMGIETEYGITVKNQPDFNPILSSLLLINSYETYRSSRIRWDYEAESPLRDARGFEYMEEKDAPSKEESRLINLILSNGARFYVDHAHPEYSSPETTNPHDLVVWDRAGERILNLSRQRAEAVSPPEQRILIYKNNTDYKGNSYGTHENYLMDRRVPFARIVLHMMPFFVTRQIFTGAGKVGAENNADSCDYQISQRADFLETEVGLETMHSRPIVNTRDEPHADPEKYRRLHVIVGDANMSEIANYLKVGTMAIVLSMVEDDFIDRDFSLDGPVLAYRTVSRDLTCRESIRLKDGRSISAVDVQREYLGLARRYYRERQAPEPWMTDVLTRWEDALDRLAEDPMQLGRELDWVIKHQLIENYIAKHSLSWDDSRVQMIDLQYHDVRPGKGLYYKLEEADAVDRIVTEDEISKAIYDPPKDTRAYFRGMCLQRYADEIVSASWDSVIFDLKEGPLKKIFMLEPLRGTEAHVRQLLTESPTAADLLRNISRPSAGV